MVWYLRVTKGYSVNQGTSYGPSILKCTCYCYIMYIFFSASKNTPEYHAHILACTSSTNTYLDRFYPNIVGLVIF